MDNLEPAYSTPVLLLIAAAAVGLLLFLVMKVRLHAFITLVLVSLLTLFSLMKIWSGAFWNPVEDEPDLPPYPVGRLGGPPLMVVPTALLTALGVGIALAAGPLYALSQRAATDLLDPSGYVRAVLGT